MRATLFNNEILGGKKYIRDLSKGNQKKVGIVAALIGDPKVIVLDEPFANLDPTTQISSFLQGQQVVLQRQVENYSRLELMQNSGYTIKLDDGGERFNIIINTGGDVYISIVQE